MSKLEVFTDDNPDEPTAVTHDHAEIADILSSKGVRFQRWQADADVAAGDSQEQVISAYRGDIDRLMTTEGYQTVDVISLSSAHPQKASLRQKFLAEHTHSEDEVRFFVAGHGLFSLHIDGCVYEVLCEKNDLIGVPAHTKHWFDMGPNPSFVAIRLFNNPQGWVANLTGDDIADKFNRLEN